MHLTHNPLRLTFLQRSLLRRLSRRVDGLYVDPNRPLRRVRATHDGEAQSFGTAALQELGLPNGEPVATTRQRAELALLRVSVLGARIFLVHIGQLGGGS